MSKTLKKFIKKNIVKAELTDELAVADKALGGVIRDKFEITCVNDDRVNELMRGIRAQLTTLIEGLDETKLKQSQLGLGHTLSRYKLKFSPDKVDTMIVQAIGLLDELDKQINIYAMRTKEWYGWHFPEMVKIVNDNLQYARCVLKMGFRSNVKDTDFSDILPTELEEPLKEVGMVSMGTDISDEDLSNIQELAQEVIHLMEGRTQLYEYLCNRMNAIAPNLTVMVGELVGARLIAHAGSLMNLAKAPASTVQILGAEKALFRALKTKHDTPKFGLIYHASLIGQAAPKNKGKISRVLAAKTALSIRVDALGETSEPTIAVEARAKVEQRLRLLEGGAVTSSSSSKGRNTTTTTLSSSSSSSRYNAGADVSLSSNKRARDEDDDEEEAAASSKKDKKEKKEKKDKKDKKSKKAKSDSDSD